jgi:hypothetical protein
VSESGKERVDIREIEQLMVGDLIRYPARTLGGEIFSKHDFLRITRLEFGFIYGKREYPEDWEREQEYVVVPEQLKRRGVALLERKDADD